jgi:hypothetical protein
MWRLSPPAMAARQMRQTRQGCVRSVARNSSRRWALSITLRKRWVRYDIGSSAPHFSSSPGITCYLHWHPTELPQRIYAKQQQQQQQPLLLLLLL